MTIAQLAWSRYRLTLNVHATTFLVGVIVTNEEKHIDEEWDSYTGRLRVSLYVGPIRFGLAIYRS